MTVIDFTRAKLKTVGLAQYRSVSPSLSFSNARSLSLSLARWNSRTKKTERLADTLTDCRTRSSQLRDIWWRRRQVGALADWYSVNRLSTGISN